ncbi:MAG: OB-fold domain-containing protein [Dehalococcoidia bacterium]|nr:OB-fold domain-containing protein [Dehalococcoidia bacterium]
MASDVTEIKPRMVPLREGMFRMPDRLDMPAALLGDRCRNCGESFFPPRVFCAACSSGEMEAVEFASTGEIDTFTIVRQQPPNSVMVPPYAIVRVRLDGGPTVQTVMATEDIGSARIGQQVQLAARRLMEDESGNIVVSFMARPIPS